MKHLLLILLFIVPLTCLGAEDHRGDAREQLEPRGFLYGIGLGVNREIYKGYDRRVIPLPIIGYRGDKLSVLGPFISYEVAQLGDFEFTLDASPRFQGFDESDSYIFAGMEERKFSMDAGVGVKYQRNDWNLNIAVKKDVFSRSKGTELTSSIGKAFRYGPVFVEPSLSLSYLDDNHVNYYYGVAASESSEIRAAYQADSALNTAVGLSVATPIFFGGFTRLAITHTWFDSSIADSPLVEDNNNSTFTLMFSKFF
jgi:outer membrane protein